ncbi:DUF2019 domain-containing protein [Rhodopseudomonas sp. BAL398]|uniref:DUF2019 domain-containing protein n=1 Tax=Rhodopseudomonas sp. BAL398 TaxID=3034676 RepID=UPI00294AF58B|nr:DUF2019 domain-containing protein [Rhodopseudomonas sp. BAL398]WOK20669.1 DUF2019 domain-containing protein [Rhodopseudomonas sp. BAL398]
MFAAIGVAQDDACLEGDTTKYNRLFRKMRAVAEELKQRPGDQRRALHRLYAFDNMQVRLMAAKTTLAIAPIDARILLREIADAKWLVQSLDAGMCLWNLERGVFVPN